MKKFILLSSCALLVPTAVSAQSTGTVDFEKDIVVTGVRTQNVGGVVTPDDSTKPRVGLTQEMLSRDTAGQTVLDSVNVIPGVSFQNNDAYGSSGGTLTLRGFDSSRVSLTFDGVPLNDSGNYAIYSNQMLDPELIERVNVNLGTTDVDSPTASAVGGTINFRTRLPKDRMGFRGLVSAGDYSFFRLFGSFDTGPITQWGTRAFIAASRAKNDNPYNNYGKVDKQQYNAKVYQPIGTNGDFIAVSGHYNQNRNNFFGSVRLRYDADVPNGFPQDSDERQYDINYPCEVADAVAGVADSPNSCGTEFDRRYNPSNTGNIRGNSRFTLAENVVLTVDPSYQYVKANGGGTSTAREYGYDINPAGGRANCSTAAPGPDVNCITGYFGGSPYAGIDLNGDGDRLDTVTVLTPSQTRTHRIGVISGIRWDFASNQALRAGYTYDRANHRQTGQVGFVTASGEPVDVFPVNDPIVASSGAVLQKRDRQSYATLHQVFGEYRGEFGNLIVNAGVRAPFFERDLQNYCFTSSASGFVECSGQNASLDAIIAANNPGWSPPQRRVLKYDKLLPNVGALYQFTPNLSAFASYAKGLSVPGTDSLYNAFYFPFDTPEAKPAPETTDSFDIGGRYTSGKVQAQVGAWLTKFQNRLASAYDPILDATVYRNLGNVDKWGFDASVAVRPIRPLTLYGWGSIIKSEIQDNVQTGALPTGVTCETVDPNSVTGIRNCAFTAGNYESGAPKYMYGASAVGELGIFQLGITAKRTGPRYVFDTNRPVYTGSILSPTVIFPSKAPAYWLVSLDARAKLPFVNDRSYLQLNVYNLFDETFVGGFGGGLSQSTSSSGGGSYGSPPFVQIGAPRTASLTLSIEY